MKVLLQKKVKPQLQNVRPIHHLFWCYLGLTDGNKMTVSVQPFCKFHQFGYSKFGEMCRNYHAPNTCFDPIKCKETSCTARHPRPCRYDLKFGHCKFGSDCSFHQNNDFSDDDDRKKVVTKLKETLTNVLLSLKSKENEIKEL